ncbi:AAA family ATPase [Kutzneria sp. NPDC051319]|uniref:AAA family ATPase n=1 Tax=Kutzneria sp. NPDC051319 TaxID=3155047 RepID=UPI0034378524
MSERSENLSNFPGFVDEIIGTLGVQSQYVLHGNIRDQFLVQTGDQRLEILPLRGALWTGLRRQGFEALVCYDPVDGLSVHPPEDGRAKQVVEALLGHGVVGRRPPLDRLRGHLAKLVGAREQPEMEAARPDSAKSPADNLIGGGGPPTRIAVVVEHASRMILVPGQLQDSELEFFLFCHRLALTATPSKPGDPQAPLRYNPIIWLVDGERDLPAWLTAGVDQMRTIGIGLPGLAERLAMARRLIGSFAPPPASAVPPTREPAEELANRTEGMTLEAMMRIARLARERRLSQDEIADAVRIYTLGVDTNPWRKASVRAQITKGEKVIGDRVRGQNRAVVKTLDILKRAALGLSGAQATTPGSRPRGVLFFAGPTGVGKTELAKQVAELLFGDAKAYLRFDMSEFAAQHAADRLVGAPPGYVGFEAGGELTGAVRRKPFQVVLFDEIEKAHPQVLDKFLQILEDGRLTDGQGVTTHFSECVLIFTSNLGIVETDPQTNERRQLILPGLPYEELEARVKAAIRDHFNFEIGRPELLNRLGDNIVVFDFIDKDTTAGEIFASQLGNISATVKAALGVTLQIGGTALTGLSQACTENLEHGGRGIGNMLESNLINPLSRKLFEEDVSPGDTAVVTGFRPAEGATAPALDIRIDRGGGR